VTERVRVGTRGSRLALRQAELVAEGLRRAWPGLAVDLVAMRTSGDRLATAHLASVGGKGLFVKEIEEALLDGRVDLAVHSLKDLPAEMPAGLTLAVFPARDDPRDVLVSRAGSDLGGLGRGARVATSSLRRQVQLLAARPDLAVEPIRGNVDTRLRKLQDGPCDALVLAAAGLRRLGLEPPGAHLLDPELMVPAVGQGTLAVQTREDGAIRDRLAPLDDPETRAAALAERAFLAGIGGSCTTPLGAYARRDDGGRLRLSAFVATPDGARFLREVAETSSAAPEDLGRDVARRMLAAGAGEIVQAGSAR
jgi:hydroxymethylbilane synthase